MKKLYTFSVLVLVSIVLYSFTGNYSPSPQANSVVFQFITVNTYGNNLYLDNFMVGSQYQNDIAALSLNNISKDTSYSPYGLSSFKIVPKAGFLNIGRENISTPFNVTLTTSGYTSTKQIASLMSGKITEVIFDSLTVAPNTQYSTTLYASLGNDQNRSNDTTKMNFIVLPGKNVVFMAFTSSTCGPCAANNPSLDAFIAARFPLIVPIKYHVNWPAPGNDPMYLANPTQNSARVSYYGVNAVPTLKVDGILTQVSGYSYTTLNPKFVQRVKMYPSPVNITVSDQRIAGDSIKATINVNVTSGLPSASYYLRVEAIERVITYASPPGTNGEKIFNDVFRRSYPDNNGIAMTNTPGNYNYTVTYKRESNWADSMMYTAVYFQNDGTKEIINAAKARNELLVLDKIESFAKQTDAPAGVNPRTVYGSLLSPNVDGQFIPELFENDFPPAKWRIGNPDGGITFEQTILTNGPSMGGNRSVIMDFYDYSGSGKYDTLTTRPYLNIAPDDTVRFDWAYAVYSPSYADRLLIRMSTDGGTTFPFTIFDKSGTDLATAPSTTSSFIPADSSQCGKFIKKFSDLTVGINPISTKIPAQFRLDQNYPNPFNPNTKIIFALPKSGDVNLKIYDLTGKEVATYVNGYFAAGTYSIDLNLSNFASGVYFYKIRADEFTDVKRMVLLK